MKNIVSLVKDEQRNQAIVTYDDGSIETFFWNTQKQGVNEEIVSVVKDDQRKQRLVVYDDGSRENIFWDF